MLNTCILYGTTNWAPISIGVLITALIVIALVYQISGFFPERTRAQLKGAAKSELTQIFLSAILIVILAGFATGVCTVTASMAKTLSGKTMNPFMFADYYLGNLSTNTGLNLLTNIYSTSVSYDIEAHILTDIGGLFNSNISKLIGAILTYFASKTAGALTIVDFNALSTLFQTMSVIYLDLFAPLITIAVGLIFIQFLMIPILQYTTFSVLLPVAIAMRSLSFMGNQLRSAANVVLAIAIAGYIIYPVMISFNAYTVSWIYSAKDPSLIYIQATGKVPNVPLNSYFAALAPTNFGSNQQTLNTLFNAVKSVLFQSTNIISNPFDVISQAQLMVNQIAKFLFTAIVMVVIDLAVTIGFVMGLTRALNGGVEGAGSFWDEL